MEHPAEGFWSQQWWLGSRLASPVLQRTGSEGQDCAPVGSGGLGWFVAAALKRLWLGWSCGSAQQPRCTWPGQHRAALGSPHCFCSSVERGVRRAGEWAQGMAQAAQAGTCQLLRVSLCEPFCPSEPGRRLLTCVPCRWQLLAQVPASLGAVCGQEAALALTISCWSAGPASWHRAQRQPPCPSPGCPAEHLP